MGLRLMIESIVVIGISLPLFLSYRFRYKVAYLSGTKHKLKSGVWEFYGSDRTAVWWNDRIVYSTDKGFSCEFDLSTRKMIRREINLCYALQKGISAMRNIQIREELNGKKSDKF